MTNPAVLAVHRFARAANRRVWCGRFLQGLAIGAGALAAAVLAAHVVGIHLAPSPWWASGLLPALVWATWRLRREHMDPATAAVHLDRRLQLDGLLLTAMSAATKDVTAPTGALGPQSSARIAAALPRGRDVRPVLRLRRVLPPPLFALLVLAATAMLPEPVVAPQPPSVPAVQFAVERLEDQLERLERGHVPDEVRAELEQKLAAMREQLTQGAVPEWSEIDRLAARLERQALLQQVRLEDAARAAAATDAGAADPSTLPAAIAGAVEALAAAGLLSAALDSLPPELAASLGEALQGGGLDPAALAGLDPAALQQLAAAMRQAAGAGQAATAARLATALDAEARQRLAEMLASRPDQGLEHQHGPECAGGT